MPGTAEQFGHPRLGVDAARDAARLQVAQLRRGRRQELLADPPGLAVDLEVDLDQRRAA